MAEIVKVKEVHLYVGLTANAQQCFLMKKYLEDNGLKYTLLSYNDESHHDAVFSAMSSWRFGRPEESIQHTITDFPYVTWKEYYSDYEQAVRIAFSAFEINNNLLPLKDLIES
jgi:hypothetical protein